MPTLTALRPTRREGRVSVHVDGRFVAAVGASFVVRHGLFVGLELNDKQLSTLRDDAGADRIVADAYRLLAHRARSRAELAARLRAKGHDEPAVQTVLDRLGVDADVVQTVLPQSDEATADELARARAALERRGPARAPLEPARKRAFEFLVRRGYSTTVAYRTVREWSAGPTD